LPVPPSLNRRAALARLSQLASACALQQLFGTGAQAQPRAAVQPGPQMPFTLGVASGEPREDSVVLWTRLAPQPLQPGGGLPPQPVAVRWQVAADEGFARIVREGEALALPEHAHTVHVEVAGLQPARVYHYRFLAGGHASATGRTRTAPPAFAPVQRLRVALASCQHYEQGHYGVHREIAARDADLVLFTGDYIYENESKPHLRVRPHLTPTPHDLDGFRLRYASYKLDPALQLLHATHPWLLTWDDHEVENDYTGTHSSWGTDAAAFLRIRTAAFKAYYENMPLSPRRLPAGNVMRLHDIFSWGRLADIWMVDTRQFRDPHACDDGEGGRGLWRCDELANPARSMLGRAQEDWLAGGLASSLATWKLVTQSQQISAYGIPVPFARPGGRIVHNDGWDGYPFARERLLRAIHEPRVKDVICLGGDAHRHLAAPLRLKPNDPLSPIVASEFIGSSMTSSGLKNPLCALMRWTNPDLMHMRGDERGYAWLDITPGQVRCELRATAHPVTERAALYTQAAFVVEAGRAGPQRA
jgi:alkaline phosphatase D